MTKFLFISIYLLILLGAAACGHDDKVKGYEAARKMGVHRVMPDLRQGGVDESIAPHISKFESLYGGSIGDITANFGSAGSTASCIRGIDARRSIIVEWSMWTEEHLDSFREYIIFHELGHCVLNKGHSSSGIMKDGPDLDDINAYHENKESLYEDLFR